MEEIFLSLLLPQPIRNILARAWNQSNRIRQAQRDVATSKYNRKVDASELVTYLGIKLVMHLEYQDTKSARAIFSERRDDFNMHPHRWEAINAGWDQADLRPFIEALSQRFRSIWDVGGYVSYDEGLMEWFGSAEYRKLIERKPHSLGLLIYLVSCFSTKTELPYILHIVPYLSKQEITPFESFITAMTEVQEYYKHNPPAFIVDSLFAPNNLLEFLATKPQYKVVAALRSDWYASLYRIASYNLEEGQWRAFKKGQFVVSFYKNNNVVATLSNAHAVERQQQEIVVSHKYQQCAFKAYSCLPSEMIAIMCKNLGLPVGTTKYLLGHQLTKKLL